jgi:hypothetical protein
MAIFDVQHGGGPAAGPVGVSTDGTGVVLAEDRYRRYAIVTADPANTLTVYLALHPTDSAVQGGGIPLEPGKCYELNKHNLYQGNIRARWPVCSRSIW